jgi:hypothetical protein
MYRTSLRRNWEIPSLTTLYGSGPQSEAYRRAEMYGGGKSDEGVVPKKESNKGGLRRLPAETLEERPSAKERP